MAGGEQYYDGVDAKNVLMQALSIANGRLHLCVLLLMCQPFSGSQWL